MILVRKNSFREKKIIQFRIQLKYNFLCFQFLEKDLFLEGKKKYMKKKF